MHANIREGAKGAAVPTGSSDAQPSSIVHAEVLEGVADEVPCWSTKNPAAPWGNDPFCPAWPRYGHDNGSTLTAEQRALLRAAVRRAIAPFSQSGISREKCAPHRPTVPALPTPCCRLPALQLLLPLPLPLPLPLSPLPPLRAALRTSPAGCRRRCAPSARSGSACMCRSSTAACLW